MEQMTYDELAVEILLGEGTPELKLVKLGQAKRQAKAHLENRFECPDCSHAGPHEDNNERGAEFALACTGCGTHFHPGA